MKKYEFITFKETKREINIVFSTTYISPLKCLNDIKKDLSKSDVKGDVLFDFLLSNGNNSKRFAKIYFNGQDFIGDTFEYIKVDKNEIYRKLSAEYYVKSKDRMNFSFIGYKLKEIVCNGVII